MISEVNEFTPQFSSNSPLTLSFSENTALNTLILSFNVTDLDFGQSGEFTVTLTQSNDLFMVTPGSGDREESFEITLKQLFNFEVCLFIFLREYSFIKFERFN